MTKIKRRWCVLPHLNFVTLAVQTELIIISYDAQCPLMPLTPSFSEFVRFILTASDSKRHFDLGRACQKKASALTVRSSDIIFFLRFSVASPIMGKSRMRRVGPQHRDGDRDRFIRFKPPSLGRLIAHSALRSSTSGVEWSKSRTVSYSNRRHGAIIAPTDRTTSAERKTC